MRVKQSRQASEQTIIESVSNTDGASTALAGAFAGTASKFNVFEQVLIYNSSASARTVDIRDGAAGAVLATFQAPPTTTILYDLKYGIKQPTANTALAFDVSAATTTVFLTIIGYKSS